MNKFKLVLLSLTLIGTIYFCMFIPANSTGAKTASMIGVFETDEYAQYPHLIRMLTPGETTYQTIRNFVVYLHYWYGYPFYFFSALAVLPVKLFCGSNWTSMSQTIMVFLRQFISVLPAILSIGILVYLQTGFKSFFRSIGLFVLLLSIPAVVSNNLWWHLDSLGLLSVCLVFLFLKLDDLKYGKYFYIGAACCGLGAGIKYLGFFFMLAIPIYIIWGIVQKRLTWKKSFLAAFLFVLTMLVTLVITNPLLLLPIERSEIIATQALNIAENRSGFYMTTEGIQEIYSSIMQDHYGKTAFLLLALAVHILVIIRKLRYRLINILILVYTIPLAVLFYSGSTLRIHYLIPVLIPIYSVFVHIFPGDPIFELQDPDTNQRKDQHNIRVIVNRWLPWVFILALIGQFGLFIQKDVAIYDEILHREKNSASISFYNQLEDELFAKLPEDQKLTIYRDWRIYLPEKKQWDIKMNWDMATLDYIAEIDPDIILLEVVNINLFADEKTIESAIDQGDMAALYAFYHAALENELDGYTLLLKNNFAYVLIRESLYQQYFVNE